MTGVSMISGPPYTDVDVPLRRGRVSGSPLMELRHRRIKLQQSSSLSCLSYTSVRVYP